MKSIALAFGLVAAGSVHSFAQAPKQLNPALDSFIESQMGTLRVFAQPQFADGKLYGCILDYSSLVRDFAYKQGGLIRVGGSLGLMTANKNLAVTLKVIVHDFEPLTAQLSPSPPSSAYLVSGAKSSKPFFVNKVESDTPGALFTIFRIDGTFETLMDALAKEKFVVAFNRKPNGADLQVPIDMTVEETSDAGKRKKSSKARDEFLECTTELMKVVK